MGHWSGQWQALHKINSLKESIRGKKGESSSILKLNPQRAGELFEKWWIEVRWEREGKVGAQEQG